MAGLAPDQRRYKVLQFVKGSERYGASVSIRNLSEELKQRGHDVSLLVHKGRTLGSSLAQEGFEVTEIEPFKKFSFGGLLRLRTLLKRLSPEILHTHLSDATLSGTLAARLSGIPSISTVHGMNKRWTYSFANRLIAVSEAGKQNLVRQGVSARKISVAYNGIPIPKEVSASARERQRQKLGLCPDDFVLSCVSRADESKGIQDAINAVAMLRRKFGGIRFLFAGEGDYLNELKIQSKALGLQDHVRFLGYIDHVEGLLASSDLFVFPSHKEAMGISLVEAMAMSLPIVASNVGGIPEVLDEKSGVLIETGNVPALACAVEELAAHEDKRAAIGRHARARAIERFSLQRSAEMVEEAYAQLMKRS